MKSHALPAWIRPASAILVGLLLIGLSSAEAAQPPAAHPQSPQSKSSKAGKKPSADSKRRKPPASGLSTDADDTLESALENYETRLAVIANNIANADTPGFKRSQVVVEDLGYRQEAMPGVQDASGGMSAHGFAIGSGSQIVATEIDFRQGKLQRTGRELDLAIEGRGFFQVKDPSGNVLYSRAGHFALNSSGQIVVGSAKSGRLLEPAITVPADATGISISPQGVVYYRIPASSTMAQAGTIQLASFVNPEGLVKIGENLYEETDGAGCATTGTPGANGFGKVQQGWIEKSNVDLRQEMAEWKRLRQVRREIHSLLEGK